MSNIEVAEEFGMICSNCKQGYFTCECRAFIRCVDADGRNKHGWQLVTDVHEVDESGPDGLNVRTVWFTDLECGCQLIEQYDADSPRDPETGEVIPMYPTALEGQVVVSWSDVIVTDVLEHQKELAWVRVEGGAEVYGSPRDLLILGRAS